MWQYNNCQRQTSDSRHTICRDGDSSAKVVLRRRTASFQPENDRDDAVSQQTAQFIQRRLENAIESVEVIGRFESVFVRNPDDTNERIWQ